MPASALEPTARPPSPGLPLRRLAVALTVGLALIAAVAAAALLISTRALSGIAVRLADDVERVHTASALGADLLIHARESELFPLTGEVEHLRARSEAERRLREGLTLAAQAPEDAYRPDVGPLTSALDRYLVAADQALAAHRPSHAGAEVDAALTAIGAFSDQSHQAARADEARAARWRAAAGAAATVVTVALAFAVLVALALLRAQLYLPVLGLSRAMARYRDGQHEARAPLEGAAELRQMAQSFNALADSLERQRRQQLHFLAKVAHDLRNPLSGLRSVAEVLKAAPGRAPEEKLRRSFELVGRQVVRLDRMVDDLLDSARIEAGEFELRPAPCDLGRVAHDVAELYRGVSAAHTLEVEAPPEPLIARCDGARLEQVLGNLVSNAIKYSPHGGRVRVVATRAGGEALLEVHDQGLGISPSDRERIFEPFQRASTAGSVRGEGLGLSTVRQIVRAHGGRVEVESELGRGSTFRVRLPLEPALPAQAEAAH